MRQRGHIKAPENWINDPNGFIFYNGYYHVFYQHFPYAPRWGTMHWGHAVSKDLVHWEHKGIALYPTKYADQNGCFSGSAVEHEGKLYLYYTGVHYQEIDPENIHKCLNDRFESCQMMLVSEDGEHFDNLDKKRVIIPPLADPHIGNRTHTRDPKVWRGKDAWYMVLGSSSQEQGKLLFYRSEDLKEWKLAGQTTRPGYGWMWECPDYFEADGEKILLFSPMGFMKDGRGSEDMAVCTLVDFEEETCSMRIPDEYQFLDYGLDLYAPQSTLDEKGRRTMIAWLRMPEVVDGKWRGMMCLPRGVEVRNGHICFPVHPEVQKAYSRKISSAAEASEDGYRISLELQDGEAVHIGGYQIWRKDGRIYTERSLVCVQNGKCRMQAETPEVKEGRRLDIYVDKNMIEIYVNNGEYVISHAVYGLGSEIRLEGTGTLEIYTFEDGIPGL